MQWTRISFASLPAISHEIDDAGSTYSKLTESLGKGDSKQVAEFALLKISLQSRLEALEYFYEKNQFDPRVHYVQELILRLEQVLLSSERKGKKGGLKEEVQSELDVSKGEAPQLTPKEEANLAKAIIELAAEKMAQEKAKKPKPEGKAQPKPASSTKAPKPKPGTQDNLKRKNGAK
eukprot:TRINITY_DN9386_c0_g1_i10.p1 TRINITY_DN9386_c0_g1~~TRINITY_DN9386_c0_g1_i10.p1  ORF type:complete len:177 (+),score=43.65 TRINITY_DN9386_c0_g1_i10:128-658(+)